VANTVNLGPYLEQYVSELVKSGRFQSRSEVLREGVLLVAAREKRLVALDQLNRAYDNGISSGEGRAVEPQDFLLGLKAESFRKKSKSGIKTPQSDIELIKRRFRDAEADHTARANEESTK
jgi:antitoxin ParD1/3/4